MRKQFTASIIAMAIALVFEPFLPAFAQTAAQTAPKPSATANLPFDPHDLSGDWTGEKSKRNNRWANKTPEPPLTDWAKQNLLYKSLSHDSYSGTLRDPKITPNDAVPDDARSFFATDLYGVPVNDPNGMYPGKDCEPMSTPAMYDVPYLGLLTFFITPDAIYELNNHHREWRIFWLNREHPKEMDPTFEGDSIAHWEGNTLVVDTIGYNGRTMVSGAVGHSKSDAFHMVERFTRTDHDTIQIDMTLSDPKAWGDKSWPGFHKYYHLVPIEKVHDLVYKSDYFTEWICSPEDNKNFDKKVIELQQKQK